MRSICRSAVLKRRYTLLMGDIKGDIKGDITLLTGYLGFLMGSTQLCLSDFCRLVFPVQTSLWFSLLVLFFFDQGVHFQPSLHSAPLLSLHEITLARMCFGCFFFFPLVFACHKECRRPCKIASMHANYKPILLIANYVCNFFVN